MKWHDKRANTVDFAETTETGKTDRRRGREGGDVATKPKVILDYNLGTQSTDVSDQMSYYAATRDDQLQDRELYVFDSRLHCAEYLAICVIN
ncbi:unnamed protein product [Lasius platythorax]|uniref:Uncharacterized protein n=1 Tax=Lasius platythorax TaxID=488582 RepID=A0AAV2P7F2_9HYME